MNRSSSTEAIILKTNKVGDIHLGTTLLTLEHGLLQAIAHGANTGRGKLRGLIFPFAVGTCYLYSIPAKNSHKITDFDLVQPLLGLREDLTRYYTASLWAETVLKSYATGGDVSTVFHLLHDSLLLLNERLPQDAWRTSVQFLWRYVSTSGRRPDLEYCACSGEHLRDDGSVVFDPEEVGFCNGSTTEGGFSVPPSVLRYLRHSLTLTLDRAASVQPPEASVGVLQKVTYAVIEAMLDQPLRTLALGSGIL